MEKENLEEKIVNLLIKRKETVASMESCTAGYFATTITNVDGSSNVLRFSAITYSNEYKVRLGVDKAVIDKYGVYSMETAKCMAKQISFFAESTYGVGITGKINRPDENNLNGKDNEVFICIFNKENLTYYGLKIKCPNKPRLVCKKYIVKKAMQKLLSIIEAGEKNE